MMLSIKNLVIFSCLLVSILCQNSTNDGITITHPKYIRKIKNGKEVYTTAETPWVVSIQNIYNGRCSGTLISSRHILTAGHCFVRIDAEHTWSSTNEPWINNEGCYGSDLYVPNRFIGLYRFNFNTLCPDCREDWVITKKAIKVVLPGACKSSSSGMLGNNDFAIIELAEDVTFSDSIRPAIVANFQVEIGSQPFVAGYGHDTSVVSLDRLRSGWTGQIIQCAEETSVYPLSEWFCTGATPLEPSVCPGDSGAGAMQYFNDRWYVVGVVSIGTACGLAEYGSGAYVAIPKHYGDICKHTTGVCT